MGGKKNPVSRQIPPHLGKSSWINFEAASALAVWDSLADELKALKKKTSARRVHKTRVVLRRWFSIWDVLKEDGWESKSFKNEIRQPLKDLLKALGELRDLDVNLELGVELGCSHHQLELWQIERKKVNKHLKKVVKGLHASVVEDIHEYFDKRAQKVESTISRRRAERSAYEHLDEYLKAAEKKVRQLAKTARTAEELHILRLGIKQWRYLLAEFFGLTNLELVRAQQLLGQLHDLDRLKPLLSGATESAALQELENRRKILLSEAETMRERLPYGLRPHVTTLKPAVIADLSDLKT